MSQEWGCTLFLEQWVTCLPNLPGMESQEARKQRALQTILSLHSHADSISNNFQHYSRKNKVSFSRTDPASSLVYSLQIHSKAERTRGKFPAEWESQPEPCGPPPLWLLVLSINSDNPWNTRIHPPALKWQLRVRGGYLSPAGLKWISHQHGELILQILSLWSHFWYQTPCTCRCKNSSMTSSHTDHPTQSFCLSL